MIFDGIEMTLASMSPINSLRYSWFIYNHQLLFDATIVSVNGSFKWCDIIDNVTVIKLIIFPNKLSEWLQKLVATPTDQIYDASVDTDTPNQSLTLRVIRP